MMHDGVGVKFFSHFANRIMFYSVSSLIKIFPFEHSWEHSQGFLNEIADFILPRARCVVSAEELASSAGIYLVFYNRTSIMRSLKWESSWWLCLKIREKIPNHFGVLISICWVNNNEIFSHMWKNSQKRLHERKCMGCLHGKMLYCSANGLRFIKRINNG